MDEIETKGIEVMKKEEDEIEEVKETSKADRDTLIKIIEKVTEIEMEKIKGHSKNKRLSDIRKLYIINLKKYTDIPNKEITGLLRTCDSTVENVLSGRYKENDFLIKSGIEIDKNVKL